MSEECENVVRSEAEWRERLTPEQYEVARKKGTELAFAGKFWDHKGDGVYVCVCCGEKLFDSTTKYDSGSGWPSFWIPVDQESVVAEGDETHGMRRVEVSCRRCGGHLGHIFEDGPRPTGLRYCINSASLDFKSRE